MDAWIAWRFAKFIGVALFTTGVLGSISVAPPSLRRFSGLVVATGGLGLVWIAGYALTKPSGLSFSEPWISRALLVSLVALLGATQAAVHRDVPSWAAASAVGGLLSAFGLMSSRGGDATILLGWGVPLTAALGTFAWVHRRPTNEPTNERTDDHDDSDRNAAVSRWFAWLARAEGTSLLLLFGVHMPLKYGAGIQLDGGQGWFGWIHGVLQLVYVVSLFTTGKVLGWGLARQVAGFVASLLPLGTFVFEHRVRVAPSTPSP